MQFKHPELLYALLLLIIPIIIHLFQLRKFQKEAFTNVQFLKDITLQTRKSSQLKKWLTLLTRLLLLACIILAFAQPYTSNKDSFNTKTETVIYLDNSYSMQAKGANGTLLNSAVKDLIETLDENETFSLFTNDISYKNTSLKAIKNELIQLSFSPNQMSYEAVMLQGKKEFSKDNSTFKSLVLISDFQQNNSSLNFDNADQIRKNLVQLKPTNTNNVAVDSVYISNMNVDILELTVVLKNHGTPIETLSISLFNYDDLVAKNAISIENKANAVFNIPSNQQFKGKISIEDSNLQYDNTLYFNLSENENINVLSINEADDTFLKKIYTSDEFNYSSYNFKDLNYNSIESQDLIIINEIKELPFSLINALKSFTDNGGHALIIPSNEIVLNSYNQLFNNYSLPNYRTLNPNEKRITDINFSHPILTNVFDKKVSNFQYPKVNSFYNLASLAGASVLSFEDKVPFLAESGQAFSFTAALNDSNSNFKNSPLIVPVLYNIGKQSLKLPQLFYTIGVENKVDIKTTLGQDEILTLKSETNSIIPLQQTYTDKVTLVTNDDINTAGTFDVANKDDILKRISFNYGRDESNLSYFNLDAIDNASVNNSVSEALLDLKSTTNVNELWKWFVIFALAFLSIEMLILKFLK
ncbi:putative membrane protein (TIGR02226 family) [Flavobacteriaceae bacterium MAR_2010_105]|nr:putative membrane protein (TIGR02226 family) [Flavobacteriaceae bacterium MAR_2010_105]